MNFSFIAATSDAFHFGGRRQQFEDLLHVDLDGAVLEPGVAEHHAQRLVRGQLLDEGFIHAAVGVEARSQRVAVHEEHILALDRLLFDG